MALPSVSGCWSRCPVHAELAFIPASKSTGEEGLTDADRGLIVISEADGVVIFVLGGEVSFRLA